MSKEANREQLKQCFIDLAKRADELNEPFIHSVCLMLAASIAEKSDLEFAMWCSIFAEARVNDLSKKLKEIEEEELP